MSKKFEEPNSLVGQILQDMFKKIEGHADFDEQILLEIRRLAEDGGLKKSPRVAQALKSSTEKKS